MGYSKEQRIINNSLGTTKEERVAPVNNAAGEFVLPNNSGDHRRSIKRNDPVNDYDIVNKAYVDSNVANGVVPIGAVIMNAISSISPLDTNQISFGTETTKWRVCNGQAVSRTYYSQLFAYLGETWGSGDGVNTFNIPDMRGIFPRGAGTSDKLTNANGAAFVGVLGTYQNDSLQGHEHTYLKVIQTANVGGGSYTKPNAASNQPTDGIVTDGVNGAPRTGAETNPANAALLFLIRVL